MDDGALRAAIVKRVSKHVGREIDPGDVDYSQSFLGGARVGGHTLDSLELVEIVTTLEDELDVPILDAKEIEEVDTIDKLAGHIGSEAPKERVESFTKQWT